MGSRKKTAEMQEAAPAMIMLPGEEGKTMPIHINGEMTRYPCNEPIEASEALIAELNRRGIAFKEV